MPNTTKEIANAIEFLSQSIDSIVAELGKNGPDLELVRLAMTETQCAMRLVVGAIEVGS